MAVPGPWFQCNSKAGAEFLINRERGHKNYTPSDLQFKIY